MIRHNVRLITCCLGSAPINAIWRGLQRHRRNVGGTLFAVIVAFPAAAGELDDCRVTVTPVAESKPMPKLGTTVPKTLAPKPKRKWTPKTRVYHTPAEEWQIECDDPTLPPGPIEVLTGPIEPPQFTPVPMLEPSPTKPEPCDCFAEATGGAPFVVPFPSSTLVVPYVPLPPAPEPSMWLLMVAGAGLIALRRKF